MKKFLKDSRLYKFRKTVRATLKWQENQFAAPSPQHVKEAVLIRNGFINSIWVETGTYEGLTTKLLAKYATKVYSIEPEPTLFENAKNIFQNSDNVEILNGTSEDIFPGLLTRISGDINFWLDGHYSAGKTFKGKQDTPIIDELKNIRENLNRFNRVCILIDDVRCFDPTQSEYLTYPPLDVLVDWAREHKFNWHIEHDIFIAKFPSASHVSSPS